MDVFYTIQITISIFEVDKWLTIFKYEDFFYFNKNN